MLWSLWKCRNNYVWNQSVDSPNTIGSRALHLLEGWRNAQQPRKGNSSQPPTSNEIKWEKSSVGRLKCIIDASFSNNKVDIGSCIRDDDGNFIAARTDWFFPMKEVAV